MNDAAAQRIRLGAGRTASGIDILVARGQLADVLGLVLDSRGAPAPAASGLFSRDGVRDLRPLRDRVLLRHPGGVADHGFRWALTAPGFPAIQLPCSDPWVFRRLACVLPR